jgi:hypothetical protein
MVHIRFYDLTPERIAKRLAEIQELERFVRLAYWRMIGLLAVWTILGSVLIALGLMSTHALWGPLLFWLGVGGGNLGITITLLFGWLEREG